MDSIQIRSRGDPAFWLPIVLILLLLVPLGLTIIVWVLDWRTQLQELAVSDPRAAQVEAVRILRLGSWSLCGIVSAFSFYLFRYFQLGRREARLPPSGWWSLGAFRAIVGPQARRMSQFGQVLAAILVAATVGFVIAVEYFIRIIEEGRLAA